MEQYISKSALVSEIERRLEKITNASSEDNRELSAIHGAQQYELINLVQYINTLEVKEIDLEKELDYRDYMEFFNQHPTYNNGNWGFDECWVLAKHFFKLGLKASYEKNI